MRRTDGLHGVVVLQLLHALGDRVRADELVAEQRHRLRTTVDDVAVDVEQADARARTEVLRRAGLLVVFDESDLAADHFLRDAFELVVEGEAVDQLEVARFARDERALRGDVLELVFRDAAVERHVPGEHRFVIAEQVFLVGLGHVARVLVRELLGRALVGADAHELGLHADLAQQTREIDMRGLETGIPNTAGGIHDDTVGARARVEPFGAAIFEGADDLLAVRFEDAECIRELFGVGIGRRRLRLHHHRDGGDLLVFGDLPETTEHVHVVARTGRRLDAHVHGFFRARHARREITRYRGRRVFADRAVAAEGGAEERAAPRRERVEVDLGARGGEDPTPAVVGDRRYFDITPNAAHAGHVERERAARTQIVDAFVVFAFDVELDRARPQRAERDRAVERAIEDGRAARRERLQARAVEVLGDERESEVGIRSIGDAGRDAEEVIRVVVLRERVLDRRAERELVVHLEADAPGDPGVIDPVVRESRARRATGRRHVVDAEAGRESPNDRGGEVDGVSARDAARIGTTNAGPPDLLSGDECQVGWIEDERFAGILPRRGLRPGERMRSARPGNGSLAPAGVAAASPRSATDTTSFFLINPFSSLCLVSSVSRARGGSRPRRRTSSAARWQSASRRPAERAECETRCSPRPCASFGRSRAR